MKTRIKYPKLGFRNATIEQRLAICGRFLRAAAQLPPEKRETIPLTQLDTDLVEAQTDHSRVLRLRALLKSALTKRQASVKNICDGTMRGATAYAVCVAANESEVLAAGLSLTASKRIRTGPPGQPAWLRATAQQGGVKLLWKNPMRRSFFMIQYKEGSLDHGEWLRRDDMASGRANITIPDLQPGVLYYFRVQARNPNGLSPWSEAVAVRPL